MNDEMKNTLDEYNKTLEILNVKPDNDYYLKRKTELKQQLAKMGYTEPVKKPNKEITGKESGMVSSSSIISPS